MKSYCTVCDWSVYLDGSAAREVNRLAIEHYVSTGHSIRSEESEDLQTQT